jgi:hypothetical protein
MLMIVILVHAYLAQEPVSVAAWSKAASWVAYGPIILNVRIELSKVNSLSEIQQNHYLRPTGKGCVRNGRYLFVTTILAFV